MRAGIPSSVQSARLRVQQSMSATDQAPSGSLLHAATWTQVLILKGTKMFLSALLATWPLSAAADIAKVSMYMPCNDPQNRTELCDFLSSITRHAMIAEQDIVFAGDKGGV